MQLTKRWLLFLSFGVFGLLNMFGCDFALSPLSTVEVFVVKEAEIHGQVGYLIDINAQRRPVEQHPALHTTAFRIVNWGGAAPIFVRVKHNNGDDDLGRIVLHLGRATTLGVSATKPADTAHLGGVLVGSGDTVAAWFVYVVDGEKASCKIIINTDDYTESFRAMISKPAKVIQLEELTPATVTEISYYLDETLTHPLTDVVMVSDTVYTKVEFSKDVPITLANDSRARPRISSSTRSQTLQYRMKPRGTILESGDAKPYQDSSRIFVAMYRVSAYDFRGEFYTLIGHPATHGSPLQVKMYQYDADDIPPNTGTTIVDWHPDDFVGQVYTVPSHPDIVVDRSISVPLPGVTITIMSGPRAGESIVTDRNGRYRFLNVPGNSLHLRTDRPRYEPKEVIVYRSQPTALSDGLVPNYRGDPQRQPGNILIGQVWLDEVRFILEETLLPYDILYVDHGMSSDHLGGLYANGLVMLYSGSMPARYFLPTLAHELVHAHQHATISIDGSKRPRLWADSPEGRAFAAARAKDWEEVGEAAYDHIPYFRNDLAESAAEVGAYYWGVNRWRQESMHNNLEETAPNRYQWAAEWLPKK